MINNHNTTPGPAMDHKRPLPATVTTSSTKRAKTAEPNGFPFIPLPNKAWYSRDLQQNKPHGYGTYITDNYVHQGNFFQGLPQGEGCCQLRNGATLSAEFNKGRLSGRVTYTSPQGREYNGRSLVEIDDSGKMLLLYSNQQKAQLGFWNDGTIEWLGDKFFELLPPSTPDTGTLEPYRFKPGTRCLDVECTPAPHSELLKKLGYIFLVLDSPRLRRSTLDVQEHIMLGLWNRNYYVIEPPFSDDEYEHAYSDMPRPDNDNMSYLMLLEERTGKVVAAIFTCPFNKKSVELHSVDVDPDLRGRSIGSLFLANTIRHIQTNEKIQRILLEPSTKVKGWYKSFGFTSDDDVMKLSLDDSDQSAAFTNRENKLAFRFLAAAMFRGDIQSVKSILPMLKSWPRLDPSEILRQYEPNLHIIKLLDPSEIAALMSGVAHPDHPDILNQLLPSWDPETTLDLLGAWQGSFVHLQNPRDLNFTVDLIDAAIKRDQLQLLCSAVQNTQNISSQEKEAFISYVERVKSIRKSLRNLANFLDPLDRKIPRTINPSYHHTSASPIPPSAFQLKWNRTSDLKDTKLSADLVEMEKIAESLSLKIEQFFSLIPLKKIVGPERAPIALHRNATDLKRRARHFHPILSAPPGTVFTYVHENGVERQYIKLTEEVLATIGD